MNKNMTVGLMVLIIALILGAYLLLSKNNSAGPSSNNQNQPATSSNNKPASIVTLTSNGFSPATLTIKAGTTVGWINKSGQDATVNSDPHPTHTNYPPLNLGSFADGASVSLVFDKPGTYGYHNHLNPDEKGTIIVQ